MVPNVNKFLTIVIPTYNREKQLIRLLKSIERQNVIEKYYIVVLNNHSNYDVKTSIRNHFPDPFVENIEIYNRPYNAGGDYNIGSAFLFAKSQYLWIIGDDDEVLDGCIDIIEEDALKYPEIPYLKYHNLKHSSYNQDIVISNICDFKNSFNNRCFAAGDIIFVSTNVYNLKKAQPYISLSLYYSYCSVPHILPMLGCLIDEIPFVLSHREIVKYNAPDGDHWNLIKISTSLSSFLDIFVGKNYKVVQDVFYILTGHFGILEFLVECQNIKDKDYRNYVFNKGNFTLYRYKSFYDRYLIFLYKLGVTFGVNALYYYINYVYKLFCLCTNKIHSTKERLRYIAYRLYKLYK